MFSLLEFPSDLTESFCGLGVFDLAEGTSGLIGKMLKLRGGMAATTG